MTYPDDYINKVICGNCLEVMKGIPDNNIDLTITSPPYDDLRDYDGYDFKFESLAKELYRITKVGGVVVWVVGDKTIDGSETGTSFKQALYFKEIGFNLHDTMIYEKDPKYQQENRYSQCFEYCFVLSKGKPNTFNPIKVPSLLGNQRNTSSSDRQKDGSLKKCEDSFINLEKTKKNIWKINAGYMKSTTDINAFEHPAIFPEKLAQDHILSWSNPNDIVLDPLCGSGTTCKMAKKNNRKFIGIDMSENYCRIARERLMGVPDSLFKGH